jgi:type IV pilus assembly protein PilC
MSTFIYEAYNKDGGLVRGEYEGSTHEEIVDYLTRRDLTPVSVEEISAQKKGGILALNFFESLTPVDIMFLVRNLSTTVKAGLSIVEALDILIADTEKNILKKMLQEAQAMIKNGQPLSKGFEAYRDSFPPIFMGMIKAGEVSGYSDVRGFRRGGASPYFCTSSFDKGLCVERGEASFYYKILFGYLNGTHMELPP